MRQVAPRITASGGAGGTGASLPDPVTVAHGGTGATTLTGLLLGAGTGTVTAGPLTGDVTTSSLAATIAAGAVSLAKMANLAANSIIGNNTGSPATPLALTAAQVKALLAIDLSGTDVTGILAAGRFPALTTDVTTSAGSLATTIANGAVTLAKMANLAANSIMGNNTGSSATPLALTRAQVMAMLSAQSGADFDMNAHKIINQADPTSAQDSATKTYVDKGVPTSSALTDAATVTYAMGSDRKKTLLATSGVGNTRALGDPTGGSAGVVYQLWYTQDGTGGRALTVSGTNLKIATALGGGTTVPMDTTANAVNLILIASPDGTTFYVTSVERVA